MNVSEEARRQVQDQVCGLMRDRALDRVCDQVRRRARDQVGDRVRVPVLVQIDQFLGFLLDQMEGARP